MAQTSIPKGTRDFTPEETAKRNYIFDTIRNTFKLFGFKSIETPAMENLSTLMGKYGEEGDKLLFKILNSGDFLKNISAEDLTVANSTKTAPKICEKGLRYDLTVPFARYVVMHRNEITFPFRRFQIQPVWRADKPQKGRYREFYQCDADIIGSDSLLNEVELIQLIDNVFKTLGINITIKFNNRKILAGIAEIIGESDKLTDITVAIDKMEKIGIDKVNHELIEKGIPAQAVDKLQPLFQLNGSNPDKLKQLAVILEQSSVGLKGIAETTEIFQTVAHLSLHSTLELDLTLARGLNYYTGAIIEVKANDVAIGSITGGGRYDNLTGIFGLPGVSGVGISFGADRIYDVLAQLDLFPQNLTTNTKIIFLNFGQVEQNYILPIINTIRQKGIAAEIYPDTAKIKKQMAYANALGIPYVALIGENEIQQGTITLKDMQTGVQETLTLEQLIQNLKK